ncbi:type II secretion system GspH family protein [Oxalobacteraceae bacterium OTU3CAMAD1]|nr:type II secretion system GspH family protein [Oxalobacteraceae bacterium OTU3CAMAD1]
MIFLPTFVTQKQRGASLLEFALIVVIVGILTTVLLQRIWHYQGEANEAAMRMTVANVRTALEIKVAHGKLPGGTIDLTMLAEQNPFDWLKDKPANYVGEYFSPSDADIGEGNWAFDRSDKSVIFLLNISRGFLDAPTKRLKFKVKLLRLPHSPAKPSGAPEPLGVAFEQVRD